MALTVGQGEMSELDKARRETAKGCGLYIMVQIKPTFREKYI